MGKKSNARHGYIWIEINILHTHGTTATQVILKIIEGHGTMLIKYSNGVTSY
jgi:hypothetical protein